MAYTYYELRWLFLIYAVAGWFLGVFAEAVRRKDFINTGVLNLPVSPVFGFSAVTASVLLSELKTDFFFLFLGGMLTAAFFAVVTNLVLEHIFHRKWRDYQDHWLGIGGSISLPMLLLGGCGAVFVLWVGNPLALKLVSLIPKFAGDLIQLIVFVLLGIDLSGTLAVVWGWRRHINRVSGLTDTMQIISDNFGNVIAQAVRRRLQRSYPNIETEKILETRAEEKPKKQEKFAEGCCFYKLALIFFIASLIGDLVETVFCRCSMGVWMSRSSLIYGPFSIIWGAGGVMLTAFLYSHRDRSCLYIFLYGTVAGGAYEYACSVVTELMFGAVFWDYKKLPFNLSGRINLLFCFLWGIASVIWLKIVYPRLSDLIEKIPVRAGKIATWIIVLFLVVDMAVSAAAFSRYSGRADGVEPANAAEEFLDRHYPDERILQVYPKSKLVR